MQMDIRLPIGMLFAFIGALLSVHGALADAAIYERSLGYNVNLIWGLVLLAFGIFMLVLGRRGTSGVRPADTTPEGRAIEQLEHRRGLESEGPR